MAAPNILDKFFNLGNKATGGDPVRKSQYDYYLYFIVFIAFLGIAISYYYNFFFGPGKLSTLLWAMVVTVFVWFNYWGLVAFRGVYLNMKDAHERIAKVNQDKDLDKDFDEMLNGFKENSKK